MQNSECRMQNDTFFECRIQNAEYPLCVSLLCYCELVFLTIATRMHIISLTSFSILSNCSSVKYSVANSNLNQYSVSFASLSAIFNLELKSALLCAFTPSATLAPMLVPLDNNCFESTYSFLFIVRCLYNFTILTANSKLFSTIILSLLIFHFFRLQTDIVIVNNLMSATQYSEAHSEFCILHSEFIKLFHSLIYFLHQSTPLPIHQDER